MNVLMVLMLAAVEINGIWLLVTKESTLTFHWILSENDLTYPAPTTNIKPNKWSCKPQDIFFFNPLESSVISYIYISNHAKPTTELMNNCLSHYHQKMSTKHSTHSSPKNIIIDLTGSEILYMYDGQILSFPNSTYNLKQVMFRNILSVGNLAEVFFNYDQPINELHSNLLFYYDENRYINGIKHILHLLGGYSARNIKFSWLKLSPKSFISLSSSALCSNFSTVTPNEPIYSYFMLSDDSIIKKYMKCFDNIPKSTKFSWKTHSPYIDFKNPQENSTNNRHRLVILQKVVSYSQVIHYQTNLSINVDYLDEIIKKISQKNKNLSKEINSYRRVFQISIIKHRIDTLTLYYLNSKSISEINETTYIDFDNLFRLFGQQEVHLWNKISIKRHFKQMKKFEDISNKLNYVKKFFKYFLKNNSVSTSFSEIKRTQNCDFIIADDEQPYFSIEKSIFSKDQFIRTFIIGTIVYSTLMGLIFLLVYSYYKCYIVKRYYTHSFWKIDKKAIEFENACKLKGYLENNEIIYYDDILDVFCKKPYILKDIQKATQLRENVRFGWYAGKKIAIHEKCCVRKNILNFAKISKYLSNLKQLSHNNFVTFVGSYIEPHKICMVYHRSHYGPLYNVLTEDKNNLDFIFLCSLINDLLNGMIFLHSSLFHYHGKLTSKCCYVEEPWCLKISDYGMRKIETFTLGSSSSDSRSSSYTDYSDFQFRGEDYSNLSFNSVNNKVVFRDVDAVFMPTYKSTSCCNGNICDCVQSLWCAPELITNLQNKNINNLKSRYQKADIYSFGVIIQEMITLDGPFNYKTNKNACKILSKIMHKYRLKKTKSKYPIKVINDIEGMQHLIPLMKLCLCYHPDRRPSFLKIKTLLKSPLSKNGVKPNIFDNIMNLLTIHSKNLNNLIEEKSGQLLKDKKKAEQFLCRMFPKPIISYLIRGLPVEPELFDQVTIYFSDIVGFTSLCANISPFQVSKILHELYTQFDEIVALYNVFKVETIGDAYMAVSGLPVRKGGRHATEICEMALNILNAVEHFSFDKLGIQLENQYKLKIRIGIHTGPVAAGIVGDTMPRYCLFGESVSIAQKMEQFGTPQCILISQSSLDLIENTSIYNISPHKVINFDNFERKTFLITGYKESSSNSGQWWKHTQSNDTLPEPYSHDTFTNETSIELNTDITENMSSRNTSTFGDDIFSIISSNSYL